MLTSVWKGLTRTVVLAVALASLALVIAACGSSDDKGTTTQGASGGDTKPAASSEKKVVGVLAPETDDNTYSAAYVRRMKELATQHNLELKIYNAKYDAATQASQAESLLAQKPDAIILWPADSRAVRPILLKAKQAGIPVDASNSEISASDAALIKTYTGPSNAQIGAKVADLMKAALSGKGRIVIIEGQPGNATNFERVKAFRARLKEVAPGIQIGGSQPAYWQKPKAVSVTTQFLSRFNNDIQGIYGVDDILAAGAAEALKRANVSTDKIKIIGTGGNKLGMPLVTSGDVYATMFQSPVEDATLAIENIVKVLNGENVPPTTYMNMPVVTKDNAGQYEAQW
jgi:ribose transport system substrate-binding protein